MTTTAVSVQWCTTCRAVAEFEQPECVDEHDGDCPEWVCVLCGDAFFVGFAELAHPTGRVPGAHVA